MKKCIITLLFLLLIIHPNPLWAKPQTKTIGVLQDGPYWWKDKMIEQIQTELDHLNQGEYHLQWPDTARLDGGYDVQQIKQFAEELVFKIKPDIILSLGVESGKILTEMKNLTIPVVAAGMMFPTAVGVLSPKTFKPVNPYVTTIYDPSVEISYTNFIRKLIPFQRITYICSSFLCDNNPSIPAMVASVIKRSQRNNEIPSTFEVVKISPKDYVDKLNNLKSTVALVGRLHQFDDQTIRDIFNLFIKNKIHSISVDGLYGVERGALAALNDFDFKQMGRKNALKMYNILNGIHPKDLTVTDNWKLELIFNQDTAEAIGYHIPIEFSYDARLIGTGETRAPLFLEEAIQKALTLNPSLIVKRYQKQLAQAQYHLTQRGYFPQLDAGVRYAQIDKTRADVQPAYRSQSLLELSLVQNIFNPELNKQIQSSRMGISVAENDIKVSEQDMMVSVIMTYLNTLMAEDLVAIRREQLRLFRKHRDIAQLRFDLEETAKSDVIRLEIQYDQGRSDLIEADQALNQARAMLVSLLNLPDECVFRLTDRDEFSEDSFKGYARRFDKFYHTDQHIKIFRDFLIEEAYMDSVELKLLASHLAKAQAEKERIQCKFFPNLTAGASFFNQFQSSHRELENRMLPVATGIDQTDPDHLKIISNQILFLNESDNYDNSYGNGWQAEIRLNVPLYSGGIRFKELELARIKIKETRARIEQLKNTLAKDIRLSYYEHFASRNKAFIAIRDVELARENLKLAEVSYLQGSLAIIDLLDIQSKLVFSEINAIVIRYQYIQSVVKLFRLTGSTELFPKTPDSPEMKGFLQKFQHYFTKRIPNFK
ncbi:MAG: TolC family protein [Candidatus Magnetomorum sp.]|nr:TolC family protein [Candidatus Magnetomorum sp.]